MKPVKLGSWTLTTGNNCEALYHGPDAERTVTVGWDRHPLTAAEQIEYLARVQPVLMQTILAYTERTHQRVLVVTLT